MSSLSRAAALALIVALALPLAACSGVRPVYQYGDADVSRLAVQFGTPQTRTEQVIYNALKLRFANGGPAAPLVSVTATSAARSVSDQKEILVTAALTVTDASGNVLRKTTRSASADYTSSSQAFANQEATDDAKERAAKLVAETLRLEILAALSR